MLEFNLDKMLFNIPADAHEKSDLTRILKDHPEVQFVSFAGLDIAGNDTDERIPIKLFIEDMDDMLAHLENIIASSTQQASANYDALIGNLNQYRDIIQSNRSELHPVDEDLEDVDVPAGGTDNLDVM